ncbi:MAG: nitrous oxide reductase accessory protein NosL [Chitinophagaceae bacterium]
MNNHLSVTSRILVAFASGALLAVYFLPAWRIDLFAPQYPEGLSMYIWINKLSGDVDIINGLNHYIGMKHISAEMFPEFRYLPYVVAFFLLLGMTAAITGKRKILLFYVILTFIGGALVLYDLYRWGYKYGHDLDPKAAIQVPGLSYQPPVLGHKRLLNFDAYSFPDVAGWIVVGAGMLAAITWLAEWYRHRRTHRKGIGTAGATVLAILFFWLPSCQVKQEKFTIGRDECYVCKMGVADLKFGGEIVTKKGKIYKFDDLGCMISYLKSGMLKEKEIYGKYVMDYRRPNEFLDVSSAWFLVSPKLNSPMNSNVAGFADQESMNTFIKEFPGEFLRWDTLYNRTR